ncbi:hypothetical protein F8388_011790 [Cannabis sativa]|uniref:AMP-dependent synthetase/ligase domain-containing protein n=1 Tax=Cannabis sativa TaxID=3483 RepID=A0A7J6FJI8_CANSA|nr:hypothetical protein F8388_011790 [Cannabis sativa]
MGKGEKPQSAAIILPSQSNLNLHCFNAEIWFYSDLIRKSNRFSELPISDVRQSDVAGLLYSSGTTGKSKGVVLSHKNFIRTSLMVTSDQDRDDCFGQRECCCSEIRLVVCEGDSLWGSSLGKNVMEQCARNFPAAAVIQVLYILDN